MSAITNLGRVSIVPKGNYSAAVEYQRLDLVTDEGSSYIYINTTPSTGTALSNESYWMLVSSVGGQDLLDEAIAARDAAEAAADAAALSETQLEAGLGSPAGVYATVGELETDYPTGDTHIYVVTADNEWYYWSGSAWTGGGPYLTADGVVTNEVSDGAYSFNLESDDSLAILYKWEE